MITHVVLFRFLDGVTRDKPAVQAMHSALQKLPGLIDEIRDWQCGFNTTPDEQAWDYILVASFQSRAALYSYFEHPSHGEVMELVNEVAEIRFGDLE
ncbi:MAG: Stress responsive Barrel Domain-containing protein [Rhodocyclales bacterium]|nr:Stress responsive Barrel Domain-containing protein [Rhodocyclales bacterium]